MSWSFTASGHATDPAEEETLVGRLRDVFADKPAGVGSAGFSGVSTHGFVSLLPVVGPSEQEEESDDTIAVGTEAEAAGEAEGDEASEGEAAATPASA